MWAIEAKPRVALAPTIPTRILLLVAMKTSLKDDPFSIAPMVG
jgi:hypothetical protein